MSEEKDEKMRTAQAALAQERAKARPKPGKDGLWAALAKAQSLIPVVAKDGENPHFKSKYATLKEVLAAVRAPLQASGLVMVNALDTDGGGLALHTAIVHVASGEQISSDFPVNPALAPQAMGSAISYARRYNLLALLQISTDDDDDAERATQAQLSASRKTVEDIDI